MRAAKYLNLLFFCLAACLITGQKVQALNSWPVESLSLIRNSNYGVGCTQCTQGFSKAYCSQACCYSCRSEAEDQDLDIAASCNAVCNLDEPSNASDLDMVETCRNSNFSASGCEGLMPFVDGGNQEQINRDFERRVQSCNEAVAYVKSYCSRNHLNSIYPVGLFELAKDITESETSCDLQSVDKYNLRDQISDPKKKIALCESNYNDCKTFCYEQNAVFNLDPKYKRGGVSRGAQTNIDGHKSYESTCKPSYASFLEQVKIRQEVIGDANSTVQHCQSEAEFEDMASDEDLLNEEAAPKTKVDNTRAVNNPEVALNNANQLLSAIQPFLPSSSNSASTRSEVARNISPAVRASSLSDEEKYGPIYEGGNTGDADDSDFILSDNQFDQPRSLQQPGPQQTGRANGGPQALGGGNLAGGGQRGRGASAGGRRGRKLQKDKSLFGKKADSTANNYDQWQQQATGSSKGLSKNEKKAQKPIFNASKYHNQILASYKKGMSSQRQKRAERLAAGSVSPKPDREYTSWHNEHHIHPDFISLFIQARICHYTLYSTNFSSKCGK